MVLLLAISAEVRSQNPGEQANSQKAGSILIFPFYGSGVGGNDTRITITNVGPQGVPPPPNRFVFWSMPNILNNLSVHLFFIDASCNQADMFVCFTKYQSYTFLASEWDPITPRGMVMAVCVDGLGNPIAYNGLVGNAFVNTTVNGNRWLGNYGAEAFAGIGGNGQNGYYYTDLFAPGNTTATLFFDDSPLFNSWGYDAAGLGVVAEVQSPLDASGQSIVTVALDGTLGAGLAGNDPDGLGALYRDDEKIFSFTPPAGGCISVTEINAAYPRIVGGITKSIGKGRTGTMMWNVVSSTIGLMVTPTKPGNAFPGIRPLHKNGFGVSRMVIPIFMAPCGGPDKPPVIIFGD